jgi:hypothetical protein
MTRSNPVMPAKAGIHAFLHARKSWVPACAGMTGFLGQCPWPFQNRAKRSKSFLVLFFKKELLPSPKGVRS